MINLQYITNDRGKKTGVLLELSEYEKLMEDIYDLAVIAERRREDSYSHEEFLKELKADGIISDQMA